MKSELQLAVHDYRGPFTILYRVMSPWTFRDHCGRSWTVPGGDGVSRPEPFVTDGASLPWWWLRVTPLLILLYLIGGSIEPLHLSYGAGMPAWKAFLWAAFAQTLVGFPLLRAYAKAAVAHDYLYWIGAGKLFADVVFLVLMVREAFALYRSGNGGTIGRAARAAVLGYRLLRAPIFFLFVLVFGWFAYWGHRTRRRKENRG